MRSLVYSFITVLILGSVVPAWGVDPLEQVSAARESDGKLAAWAKGFVIGVTRATLDNTVMICQGPVSGGMVIAAIDLLPRRYEQDNLQAAVYRALFSMGCKLNDAQPAPTVSQ